MAVCVPLFNPTDHTVEMGMMVQGLAPGMQHREEADVRAEMPRIAWTSRIETRRWRLTRRINEVAAVPLLPPAP